MEIIWTETQRCLEEYAKTLVARYRANLIADNSVATFGLYENIEYKVTVGEWNFDVAITLEDYWKYVEYGRKAGGKMPPIDAIEKWIQAKPITPEVRNGRLPTVKQLAFLIARSIGVNGIPAKRGFQKAYDSLYDGFMEELRMSVARDLRDYVVKSITVGNPFKK